MTSFSPAGQAVLSQQVREPFAGTGPAWPKAQERLARHLVDTSGPAPVPGSFDGVSPVSGGVANMGGVRCTWPQVRPGGRETRRRADRRCRREIYLRAAHLETRGGRQRGAFRWRRLRGVQIGAVRS